MAIVGTACLVNEAVLSIGLPWLFFVMGWPWPALVMKMVWLVLLCCTALLQLHVATGGLDRQRTGLWLVVSTVALVLYFVHAWSGENDSEALKKLPYEPNVYPAYWLVTPEADVPSGLDALWRKDWSRSGVATDPR